MGNRKLPFGYRMAMGEIDIHPSEAELVQSMFCWYLSGASMNEVVEQLRQQEIVYAEGRRWNKGIVSRILEDRRYTGEKNFPVLIQENQYHAVALKRAKAPQLPRKTDAQKVLRRLCGQPVNEQLEKQVAIILASIVNGDIVLQSPGTAHGSYTEAERAVEKAFESQPIDEVQTKTLIFRLAEAQYSALNAEEYETVRLRHIFARASMADGLNADLLERAVSRIVVTAQSLVVYLKNNQRIERKW